MMAIRATARAAALTLTLAATPALAQDQEQQGSPGEMAREGVEQLMNAIETFVHSLPMYGAPRIDEEGNIVIPRLDKQNDESKRTPERKPDNPDNPNKRAPNSDGGVTEI